MEFFVSGRKNRSKKTKRSEYFVLDVLQPSEHQGIRGYTLGHALSNPRR